MKKIVESYKMKKGTKNIIKSSQKNKVKITRRKNGVFIDLLGNDRYEKLLEMGNSKSFILKWQRKRVINAVVTISIGGLLSLGFGKFQFVGITTAVAVALYVLQSMKVDTIYKQFRFERHLAFSKFTRMLVPYLQQKKDGGNLYGVFNKILKRLDHETDKKILQRLMQEMRDNPKEIQPFIDFAKRTSGTNMSILFMCTIFDVSQGYADLDVVKELDEMASHELMIGIDSIIEYKSRKFNTYPTKFVMSVMIIMVGIGTARILQTIQEMFLSNF